MRILNIKNSNKKKVRGLKRKSQKMIEYILDSVKTFPDEDREGCGYWHTHLPVAQSFIDSTITPRSIRKLCIQTLINAGKELFKIKPNNNIITRIVILINLPYLWDSQIIVFYGEDYFSTLFDRNSDYQKWT